MSTGAALLLFGLLGVVPVRAAGTTLWVDGAAAGCSDTHTRAQAMDAGTPWCTIERGVEDPELLPGDVVIVRGGLYSVQQRGEGAGYDPFNDQADHCDMRPVRDGTREEPITLRAQPGETVVVDGRWPVRTGAAAWKRCPKSKRGCPRSLKGRTRRNTWFTTYRWDERFPYLKERGQMWIGEAIVPSVASDDLGQFKTRKGYWAKDFKAKRLYVRPAIDGQDPNDLDVRYAGCAFFFLTNGRHGWTIEGITWIGATGVALMVEQDPNHSNWSTDIRIVNNSVHHVGNNACTPTRDGSFGYALSIGGANAELGTVEVVGNDFSQCVAENVHVSNRCANEACGEIFRDNSIHDSAVDPGWDSQCAETPYGPEKGFGLIVRSNGGVYEGNRIVHNDGPGLSIEGDATGSPASSPSGLTIRKNVVTDNASVGIDGQCNNPDEPSVGNLIADNVLVDNAVDGIQNGGIRVAGHCVDWQVLNNSVLSHPPLVGGGPALVVAAQPCGDACRPQGTTIVNNAWVTSDDEAAVSLCAGCDATIETNLLHSADENAVFRLGDTVQPASAVTTLGTGNLFAAPAWDETNLLPLPGSPLLGAGLNLFPQIDDNVLSEPRPMPPAAWNIGSW